MSNKTIQTVFVGKHSDRIARLRKEFIMEHWPKFLEIFPGMPGFISEGAFEQKALELLELGKVAEVSITGTKWPEDDLEALRARPAKDLVAYLKSNYNRQVLANTWRSTRDQFLMDQED